MLEPKWNKDAANDWANGGMHGARSLTFFTALCFVSSGRDCLMRNKVRMRFKWKRASEIVNRKVRNTRNILHTLRSQTNETKEKKKARYNRHEKKKFDASRNDWSVWVCKNHLCERWFAWSVHANLSKSVSIAPNPRTKKCIERIILRPSSKSFFIWINCISSHFVCTMYFFHINKLSAIWFTSAKCIDPIECKQRTNDKQITNKQRSSHSIFSVNTWTPVYQNPFRSFQNISKPVSETKDIIRISYVHSQAETQFEIDGIPLAWKLCISKQLFIELSKFEWKICTFDLPWWNALRMLKN